MRDIPLATVTTRISQLVQKNSDKFTKQQEKNSTLKADLAKAEAEVQALTERSVTLSDEVAELEQVAPLEQELARIEAENDALKKRIEGLKSPSVEAGVSKFIDEIRRIKENSDSNYQRQTIEGITARVNKFQGKGIEYPTPDVYMQDVNSGRRTGFSEQKQRDELEDSRKTLAGLKSGAVKPRSVIGTGGTKKLAIEYIENKIRELEHSLANGGIFYSVNLSNYAHALKDFEEGKDAVISDDQIAAKEQAAKEKDAEIEREAERIRELAGRVYEVGDFKDMKKPLWFHFNVTTRHSDHLLASVAEATTPEEKFNLLKNSSLAKQKEMSFSDKVDFNSARKKGAEFGYFSIEPRKGYKQVKMAIDLSVTQKPEATGPSPEITEIEDINVDDLKEKLRTLEDWIDAAKDPFVGSNDADTGDWEKRADEIRAQLSAAGVDLNTKPSGEQGKRENEEAFNHPDPLVMEVYHLEKEWKGAFRNAKRDGGFKRRLRALAKRIPEDNEAAVAMAERFATQILHDDWDNHLKSDKPLKFGESKNVEKRSPAIAEAAETLRKAAAGEFKNFAATMDAAEKAILSLESFGVADEYEELISQVTDRAFAMDTAENGA